jgi:hypothetical protein
MATFFPNFMMANQEKLAKDTITSFDDDPDEYEFTPPAPANPTGMMGVPGEMTAGATAGQQGLPQLPGV